MSTNRVMPVRREGDDPISLLLAPPPDETDEERVLWLQREAEARRISDEIDEQIKKDYAALKKQNVLKMLLLGQSESGRLPFMTQIFTNLMNRFHQEKRRH